VYRKQPESTALNPGKVVPLAGNLVSGRGTVLATPTPALLCCSTLEGRFQSSPRQTYSTPNRAKCAFGCQPITCCLRNECMCGRNTREGCICALGQVGLTLLYWCRLCEWLESLRQELRLSIVPVSHWAAVNLRYFGAYWSAVCR